MDADDRPAREALPRAGVNRPDQSIPRGLHAGVQRARPVRPPDMAREQLDITGRDIAPPVEALST